jgi:cytochrome P450
MDVDVFCRALFQIMGKFAYNHDYGTLNEPSPHYDDYNELVTIMGTSSFLLHLVNLSPDKVKSLPYYNRVYKCTQRIHSHLMDVVKRRKNALEDMLAVEREEQTDVLAKMLTADPEAYEDHQLVWEMLGLFSAAHDSTAASIAFAMYHLARYPNWQTVVRREVKAFFQNWVESDEISLKSLQTELPSLQLVMLESWRLLPPASGTLSRQAAHDHVYLNKFRIPKNVSVASSIVTAHHSKEIWGDDADEFNPLRFCQGPDNGFRVDTQKASRLITFGCGRRSCLGLQFATMQNYLALAKIISQFELKIPADSPHAYRCLVRSMVPMTSPVDLQLEVTRLS